MRAHLALLSETNAPAMGQRSCWEASQPPDYLLLTRSSPAAQASSPMTLASPIKRPPKDRRFRHSGVRRPLPRLKEIQSRDGAVLRARLACRRATATHHSRWWAPVTSATSAATLTLGTRRSAAGIGPESGVPVGSQEGQECANGGHTARHGEWVNDPKRKFHSRYSSGRPILRKTSKAGCSTGFRSVNHLIESLGFMLRASAKAALASSVSPLNPWATARLR